MLVLRRALVSVVLVGCTQPPAELPWLHGVEPTAVSTSVIAGRNPDESASPCGDDAFGHIELLTDLTADPGLEAIRAAPAHGVQVHGAAGELLLQAVAAPCEGAPVRIAALAVAAGMVLVVDERGSASHVTVLRPGPQRRLERAYAGVIERGARTGTLAIVGGRLIHTDPDGVTTVRALEPQGAR